MAKERLEDGGGKKNDKLPKMSLRGLLCNLVAEFEGRKMVLTEGVVKRAGGKGKTLNEKHLRLRRRVFLEGK